MNPQYKNLTGQKIGDLAIFEKNTFSKMFIGIGLDSIFAKKWVHIFDILGGRGAGGGTKYLILGLNLYTYVCIHNTCMFVYIYNQM